MKKITLNTFRRVHRNEEQMIRASMPKTSALDPEPLVPWFENVPSTATKTLTYTMKEVAR